MTQTSSDDRQPLSPGLHVVATPLGNLGDISTRAVAVLRAADVIAAEDTRHSGRLMQHLGVTTPMIAYHDFSGAHRRERLLERLRGGEAVALISDAGTPLISDPGYLLVSQARSEGIDVRAVPGPSALTAAISVAGLPSDRFAFEGFPPARSSARCTRLRELVDEPRTLVFYESPHRIVACLQDMVQCLGAERPAALCRELTKQWETVHSGTLAAIHERVAGDPDQRRGEIVLVVQGVERSRKDEADTEAQRVLDILLADLPVSQAAALAAQITGIKKNVLYRLALDRQ